MTFRYVDRPVELLDRIDGRDVLQELDDEKSWIGQYKADGWCTIVIKDTTGAMFPDLARRGRDKSLLFCSRRPMVSGGPTAIPVSDVLVDAVELMALPDQTALAGEWMARRTIGECPEKLFLFDALYIDNKWIGDVPFSERLNLLGLLCDWGVYGDKPGAEVCRSFISVFRDEFDRIRTDPKFAWTEGLVFKRRSGTLIGDNKRGVDNGTQIKVKWRSGASGREVFK